MCHVLPAKALSKFAASKLANDSFDDGAAAGAAAVADALLVAADNGEAPNGSSPEAGNAGLPPFAVGGGGVAVTPLAEATEETDDRDGLPSGTLNERKIDASHHELNTTLKKSYPEVVGLEVTELVAVGPEAWP